MEKGLEAARSLHALLLAEQWDSKHPGATDSYDPHRLWIHRAVRLARLYRSTEEERAALRQRAEAAEARVRELEGAVQGTLSGHTCAYDGCDIDEGSLQRLKDLLPKESK